MRPPKNAYAMSLEAVARELGLSRERVRQIEVSALLKLRRRGDELPEPPQRPEHHLGAHVRSDDDERDEARAAARRRWEQRHPNRRRSVK